MKKLFFLYLFSVLIFRLQASNSIAEIKSDNQSFVNICEYLCYYEDKTDTLEFNEILKLSTDSAFLPLNDNEIHIDFDKHIHWFFFRIRNNTNIKQELLLELNNATIDRVRLFQETDSMIVISTELGDQVKNSEIDLLGNNAVYKLNLYPHTVYNTYFYVDTGGDVLNIPVSLTSLGRFVKVQNFRNILIGLFIGVIIILIITSFFTLYSNVKEGAYYNYLLYMVFVGIWVLTQDGIMYRYVWGSYFNLNNILAAALPLFAFYFFTRFAMGFLVYEKSSKYIFQGLRYSSYVILASITSILLGIADNSASVKISLFVSEVIAIELIIVGFISLKSNRRAGIFFLLAFFPYVLGLVTLMLNITYGYANLDLRSLIHKLSLMSQMLILFIALNDKMKRQRKEIQEELKKSETRYKELFENAVEAIFVGRKKAVLFFNKKYEQFIGVNSEGTPISFIESIAENDRKTVLDWQEKIVSGAKAIKPMILQLKSQEGKPEKWGEMHSVKIDWEEEAASLNFIIDISERIKGEKDRKTLEMQLQKSQKMETIGNLAGGIAHDFNNILTPIVGYSDILLDTLPEDHELREDIENIASCAYRAKDLVKQILLFSRQVDVELTAIDVKTLLQDVLKLLRATIPANVALSIDHKATDSHIYMNYTQAHQIFMNIGTNAFQAMEGENGEIKITTSIFDATEYHDLYSMLDLKPLVYVKFSVFDTGKGMDNETIKRIFDPFYTTKRVGEGTGLGLSVVQGIVHNNTGIINVESEVGVGTRFDIFLPLYNEKGVREVIKTEQLRHGTENIVVVDDEKEITLMLNRFLVKVGYSVKTFNNPEDALQFLRIHSDTIDLILTDLTMPKISGVELIKKVQKINPAIKVLLMSGFTESVSNNIITDDYSTIIKPIDIKYLSKEIRKLLD